MATNILQLDGFEARAIPGYRDYFAAADGRIWSTKSYHGAPPRPLRSTPDKDGYLTVTVNASRGAPFETWRVHQLVALAWVGPRTGPVVRHLDGNHTNNRPDNLAYGSFLDNVEDDIRLGKCEPGSRSRVTRLGHDEMLEMVQRVVDGEEMTAVAREYDFDPSHLSKIVRGKFWKPLQSELANA